MKQNPETEKQQRWRRIIWTALVVITLGIVNCLYFIYKVSSNHTLASHYTEEGDPMAQYRNPAVAGLFYPSDAENLSHIIDSQLNSDYQKHLSQPKIIIVPHAGYQYSAPAAAQAYMPIKDYADKIKTVILLGPSHYVELTGAALPNADYFKTPLGQISVDNEILHELRQHKIFSLNSKAHEKEHSIEVQLPFLQKLLPDFKIVPIVYGNISPDELAQTLLPYVKRPDVLLVVSADLSHYHKYTDAVIMDTATAEKISEGKADVDYHHSCGAGGINTALLLASKLNLKPEVLALINSGDTGGDQNRVVGYGAWSFSNEGAEVSHIEKEYSGLQGFATAYGEQVLSAARKSLEFAVQNKKYRPSRREYDDHLFDRGAVFVTLTKNGELRGCIGSLYPHQALVADVTGNAYNAALNDGRFSAITEDELNDIKISVSMLTGYERINYKDEADLLSQLRPGVDGLVIRDGNRQGLFLPSVWEQIPDSKNFLNNLKLKAGMSPSFWSNDIKVYRFRTVEIKENAN
ncbi:MAG: AmmeMemoRadiSam system protein B [Rhodospirillales bacterium]|nr:AmmeMemoRadiSam system protein B [Rhodospirillales bacterium]